MKRILVILTVLAVLFSLSVSVLVPRAAAAPGAATIPGMARTGEPDATYFFIGTGGPARISITDPSGRTIGYGVANDFSSDDAYYYGADGSYMEFVLIKNPKEGSYQVTVTIAAPAVITVQYCYLNSNMVGTAEKTIHSASGGPVTLSVEYSDSWSGDTPPSDAILLNETQPPVTSAALSGTGGPAAFRDAVTMTLSAADNIGVALTEYSMDGGMTWATYRSPFQVDAEGTCSVLFRSTDDAGNQEGQRSVKFFIDRTPPTVALTSPTDSTVAPAMLSMTAKASDNIEVAKVIFRIDDEVVGEDALPPYKYAANMELFVKGTHTARVEARDAAGNSALSSEVIFSGGSMTCRVFSGSASPGEYGEGSGCFQQCWGDTCPVLIN